MKNLILGLLLLVAGLTFLIYISKEPRTFKHRDPMGKIAHLKGYFGAFLLIIAGILKLIKELY